MVLDLDAIYFEEKCLGKWITTKQARTQNFSQGGGKIFFIPGTFLPPPPLMQGNIELPPPHQREYRVIFPRPLHSKHIGTSVYGEAYILSN